MNGAAFAIVVDGVGEEVGDDLADAAGVAVDLRGGEVGVDGDVFGGGDGLEEVDGFAGGGGEVEGLEIHALGAGVEPGELEERFGEVAHALGGALAGFEGGAIIVGGAFAGEGGLGLREDDGEGSAEFVRGVGGELALLLEGGVEAREGGVENGGEAAEFAFGFGGIDAMGEIAGRDARGGGADAVDWLEREA